ncbi:sensor histidine kinase [Streptomyces sp. NPDC006691]|uniref:sensor histidine kinase n=1 Tax=Streptomyces sp. NPDC006691 TaxID=3364757 RepID=UPI003681F283
MGRLTALGGAATTVVRSLTGIALGVVSAVAGLVFLALAAPVLAVRPGNRVPRAVAATALRLARLDRLRVTVLLGGDGSGGFTTDRALRYLASRWPVGLLGAGALTVLGFGLVTTGEALAGWLRGERPDGIAPTWPVVSYLLTAAALVLFLDLAGLAAVVALERYLVHRFLGPSEREVMRRRIDQLSASRAGIVEAVDAERRRIERDLHDGLQQRLVAMAMLMGRARRNGSDELYAQAHEEAQRALDELREVAWRVYPAHLDQLGLEEALATVAERSAVPVRIRCGLGERQAPRIETAAYFTVREAVTNAAKHAGATRIDVDVALVDSETGPLLSIRVTDDGAGGADPGGTGLAGLARRAAALDGRFAVHSPTGGPTLVEAELPCG